MATKSVSLRRKKRYTTGEAQTERARLRRVIFLRAYFSFEWGATSYLAVHPRLASANE
jgi:hypothetical protein